MRHIIYPLAACALLFCGCPKKQSVQGPAAEPLTEAKPATSQPGPEAAPFPEQPAVANPLPLQTSPTPQTPTIRLQSGWRVQLFASGTRENARRVAEEARWKFPEHQIFIIEQEGLHKVQLGNGLERAQADQLKQRAKDQGYAGAFAVEFNIGP